MSVANRPPCSFNSPLDVGRIGSQHPQTGACVGDNAGQRLIDFVRNRCRQGAEARHSAHVCKI